MEVLSSSAAWRAACEQRRAEGRRVDFVPTMGALHAGHFSLLEAAASRPGAVAMSIFVNPLQFADPADLERYPRPLEADLALAEAAGCELVFTPQVAELYPRYPEPSDTTVRMTGPALGLEGGSRAGHFDGVATVLTILFALTGACTAFFGEKDYQQLVVVRRLVSDLGLPVGVVGCPTVRDDDGLARSSRNERLSAPGRLAARSLHRALQAGADRARAGADGPAVEAAMAEVLAAEPLIALDYAVCVDPVTLAPAPDPGLLREVRLLIAAEVDGVRLLDNLGVALGSGT